MSDYFDLHIEEGLKALENFKKWREIVTRVRDIAHRFDPKARIYLFGSVARGRLKA